MNTELTDDAVRDMAYAAHESALAYGVSADSFVRLARSAIAADRAARIGEFPALPKPDHATVLPWDKDATLMVFFTTDQMRAYAAQAVEADRAARGVPEGWRLVPAEPTQEMYQSVIHNGYYHDDPAKVRSVLRSEYQDMLAAAPQPAAPQPETVFQHEVADKFASDRYRVVKSRSTIWPNSVVVAGDGEQELFSGSNSACKHVARKLVGAFLDGAFYTHSFTAQTVRKPMPLAKLQAYAADYLPHSSIPAAVKLVRDVEDFHGIKDAP